MQHSKKLLVQRIDQALKSRKITQVNSKKRDRFYRVEGYPNVSFPSVTSILTVINKPGLAFWDKNLSLSYIQKKLSFAADSQQFLTEEWIQNMVCEARKAGSIEANRAATFGTRGHQVLEDICSGREHRKDSDMEPIANAMSSWMRDSGYEIIFTEQMVYSAMHEYAGSVDAIALTPSACNSGHDSFDLVIFDWKISSKIRTEYALQLAAYAKALEEMSGTTIEEAWVIRFGKEAPEYEARQVKCLDHCFRIFQAALTLYKEYSRSGITDVFTNRQYVKL